MTRVRFFILLRLMWCCCQLMFAHPSHSAHRRSLQCVAWRGWRLTSDIASVSHVGLKQLSNRRLIGLEQFSRPLESF